MEMKRGLRKRGWGVSRQAAGLAVLLLLLAASAIAQVTNSSESARAFHEGDYQRAAALAEAHLKQQPNSSPARIILARIELMNGRFQEAYMHLRKVLATDPTNVDALYYLAAISGALSQGEFEKLYALAPDSARVHQLLAEAAHAQENTADAEAEYRAALEVNPRLFEALVALGELKRSQSYFDEAITYYARAEDVDPNDFDTVYGLGACYEYKQDRTRAIAYFRRAVALAPDSAVAHFALGNSLFQTQQYEAALPELEASIKLEPQLRQSYYLMGRAYQKLGRQQEAKEAFKRFNVLINTEVKTAQDNLTSGDPIQTPSTSAAPRSIKLEPSRKKSPKR